MEKKDIQIQELEKQNKTVIKKVHSRIIRLKLSDGSSITGQINISRNPSYEYDRLSDLLTQSQDNFLVLFSASMNSPEYEKPIRYKTIFINKRHIIWAVPEDRQN